MRLSQAIIETLHKLPLWVSMLQTVKVLHSFPRLIKPFPLTLGETSDSFSDLVGPTYGEILLQELLLHLNPPVIVLAFKELTQYLALSSSENEKRRIFKASFEKFCILMVEQISRNSSRCL
jgi:hypothetical protein